MASPFAAAIEFPDLIENAVMQSLLELDKLKIILREINFADRKSHLKHFVANVSRRLTLLLILLRWFHGLNVSL